MSLRLYGSLFLGNSENSFKLSANDNTFSISQNNVNLLDLSSDITPTPTPAANLFDFQQTSQNSLVLKMNRNNMLDSNQTLKISGMQIYLSGIELENRSATSEYLNNSEKHSLLENWIVACNTIQTSAENNGNPISIVYFENDSTNTEIYKENDQIDLCVLPFAAISGNVQIYNTEPYKTLVVDVLNNQVIEHTFVI
tara:strand:+ start:2502 stop:3092 length:591 start_codon:yes stop_codon:yes gene_type:complete